jgi:DNA-directed RNA polymerase beta' subunit
MGFNPQWSRPEWMICQILPVPPPAVRPSVKHDAQQRSEDDLTHIYSNIIKYNNNLKERLNSNDSNTYAIDVLTTILQHSIAMIVNNKIKGVDPMAQRSGRPYQCIMGRINSKNGRIRGNLMGKRVDFSARSVITGDPNLSMRQIGVPLKIAKNLTKPIVVNARNHDFLMKLIQNGPDVYPGAKILERRNGGDNISLRYVDRESIVLEHGDIVHRHMMDGDMILFNRQPSLHRASMMGHIVKVMHVGDSFRINVAVTRSYNADFDGDEMNLHLPQSIITETELRHLAATPYQIVNPGSNKPLIAIFQDSLLGAYRFTRPNIKFTLKQAMNLLMGCPNIDVQKLQEHAENDPEGAITNFNILSQITPPITLKYKTGLFNDSKDDDKDPKCNNVLEINAGEYVRGQMDKSVFEAASKGIIHRIHNDYGPMACSDYNDQIQSIITEYMKTSSYSVGISDLIADRATNEKIVDAIRLQKMEVQTIMDKIHVGIFENNTAQTNQKHMELLITNVLNKATEESGKIGKKSLNENNRFLMIVDSGSKGNLHNISQMISCLGQQTVDGKRISYGFDDRTLPHFKKYDDSPNSRGFVENSYITGLTAPELFFHAMAGRTGLIDTAVKSVTGDTPIFVIDNDVPLYINIGDWIDYKLNNTPMKFIEHHPNDRNLELIHVEDIYIPSTDADGNLSWSAVTAVTRHDPGKKLYRMTTVSGRSVVVPESKSLLIWNEETKTFQEKLTPEVKIGDAMPVTETLCEPFNVINVLKLGNLVSVELTKDVGTFFGIYLACGKCFDDYIHIRHGNIQILECVNLFFNKMEVPFDMPQNDIITASDDVLSFALHHLFDSGKTILADMFIANEDFVIGFLSGYFSSCANVCDNTIRISVKSKAILDGMNILCNRIGVHGQMFHAHVEDGVPLYTLSIHNQWGKLFNQRVKIYDDSMLAILEKIEWGYDSNVVNNVVLDRIQDIDEVPLDNYPKLYDLTVPSTNNFGLANGLHVYDTSQTGYIQRRLVKGLEDLMVSYDMTVRNNKGKIIQYMYGDDNFDSTRVENQILPLANMSVEDIYMHFDIPGMAEAENNLRLAIFTKETITRMNKQREKCKDKCYEYATRMINDRDKLVDKVFLRQSEVAVKVPVAFQYLIQNIQGQLDLKPNSAVDITPFEAFELIEEYYTRLNSIYYAKTNELFRVLYFYYLTPRDLLVKRHFHKKGLLLLLETVLLKYKEALVHPGEMVGVVAAQSCGEPCTQLTLNTFHSTGISSKSNVTRGVPRIEEILRLTKNPKNPSMTVALKPLDETSQDTAQELATWMTHTRLVDVVKSVKICFDPNPTETQIEEDHLLLEQFFEFENMIKECIGDGAPEDPVRSKWILRMEMDDEALLDKNVTMDDIHFAIANSEYGKDIHCLFSDHNTDKLVFRIRTNGNVFDKSKRTRGSANPLDQSDDIYLLKNFQDNLLNNIVLRGVNGIQNVLPRKVQNSLIKESDKFVKKETWVLDTTGSNLLDTLALDYIDYRRTISNDIKEVFHVLGIEAARQCIQNELVEVLAFSGASVNYHHTSLLCDRMTCNKDMVSIFRSGILNDDIGPVTKSTFEVHTEVMLNATRHGELDHMRGVSANIMCGQQGSYGTNSFQVILDMKALEAVPSAKYQSQNNADEIERGLAAAEEMKGCSNIEIQNNIQNIKHGEAKMECLDDGYNAGF